MNAASDPASPAPASRLGRAVHYLLGSFSFNSLRDLSGYCLFLGGFLAVLFYFGFIDVYDNRFFARGDTGIYNTFRVVFVAYLFWIVYFTGQRTLLFVAGDRSVAEIDLHDRLALGFFVGAAALTIVMLVLGYLYLYWRAVAALIAISIVAISYPHFALVVRQLRSGFARYRRLSSTLDVILSGIMLLAVIFFGGVLLLVKGLYPQGGHDYYLHYSQFYTTVIDSHSIWPNDFWYQYYYSKGLGVMFLGMLLTDPLAPSLVTYCFVVATAVALYS